MRENFKIYERLIKNYRSFYGIKTLLLYQIGIFYYLFSVDIAEMEDIKNITRLPWSKSRATDNFYKCWFQEDKLDHYADLLYKQYYTVVIYDLNKNLCSHKRMFCECKKCFATHPTHLLKDAKIPEEELGYLVVREGDRC